MGLDRCQQGDPAVRVPERPAGRRPGRQRPPQRALNGALCTRRPIRRICTGTRQNRRRCGPALPACLGVIRTGRGVPWSAGRRPHARGSGSPRRALSARSRVPRCSPCSRCSSGRSSVWPRARVPRPLPRTPLASPPPRRRRLAPRPPRRRHRHRRRRRSPLRRRRRHLLRHRHRHRRQRLRRPPRPRRRPPRRPPRQRPRLRRRLRRRPRFRRPAPRPRRPLRSPR